MKSRAYGGSLNHIQGAGALGTPGGLPRQTGSPCVACNGWFYFGAFQGYDS